MTVCSVSKVQQMYRSPKMQSCQQSADLCKGKQQYQQLCNPNQTILPGDGLS